MESENLCTKMEIYIMESGFEVRDMEKVGILQPLDLFVTSLQCQGRMIYCHGDTYDGDFKRDHEHGTGKFISSQV